jgi:hypothetical protein
MSEQQENPKPKLEYASGSSDVVPATFTDVFLGMYMMLMCVVFAGFSAMAIVAIATVLDFSESWSKGCLEALVLLIIAIFFGTASFGRFKASLRMFKAKRRDADLLHENYGE